MDDPQDYIVGVQITTKMSTWIYGASAFQNFVTITYRLVEPEMVASGELSEVLPINHELFYPLKLGNK